MVQFYLVTVWLGKGVAAIEGAALTNTKYVRNNNFNNTVIVIAYVIYNQVNSTAILFNLFEAAQYVQYNSSSPSSQIKTEVCRKLLFDCGGFTTPISTSSESGACLGG